MEVFCNCINVYAPHDWSRKQKMGEDLSKILLLLTNEPCCIIGDFNCILSEEERRNCVYRRKDTDFFKNFINSNNLWNLSLRNYKFTWFGPQDKCSRIDRATANLEWSKNRNWELLGLGRKSSDHIALFLSSSIVNWGPRPFKIFNAWLKKEGLKALVAKKMGRISFRDKEFTCKAQAYKTCSKRLET